MKYHFSSEEVITINTICSMCDKCKHNHYCTELKTDSVVFKYDKCNKLKEEL